MRSPAAKSHRGFLSLIVLIIVLIGGFFLTRPRGQLLYHPSLTADEVTFLENALHDQLPLSQDLEITATTVTEYYPTAQTFLYDVLVPVADFYTATTDLPASALPITDYYQPTADHPVVVADSTNSQPHLLSVHELTPAQKLLSLDGHYYLDDFSSGAYFRILEFPATAKATELIEVLTAARPPDFPTADTVLSFAQTGVTALTRGLLPMLEKTADGAYFAANIQDFLRAKDLTHISNEVSFADNCHPASDSVTLCADPRTLATITAIGTDIIELTGNHNLDYGAAAALDTLKLYQDHGLQVFGGGGDAAAAARPLTLKQKSTSLTLLGYNYSTGGYTTDQRPGANFYTEERAAADLRAAKARGDFTIVDLQFYECYCYPDAHTEMPACDAPITQQTAFFRHLIDLGADLVIGTQAHQPQTYELYRGKPIFYGLGNLFFDQISWPGTTRSLILTHYFLNGRYLQTRISPTIYDANYQPALMSPAAAKAFLARLLEARPAAKNN